MKYLVRAMKYYLYMVVILALIVAILMLARVVPADLSQVFRGGYDSLWQMALMMAVFAAIYPKFGYARQKAVMPGEPAETLPVVKEIMDRMGYKIEKEEQGLVTFRRRSFYDKVMKIFEDRITVTTVSLGYEVEGINKDVVRIVNALRDAR